VVAKNTTSTKNLGKDVGDINRDIAKMNTDMAMMYTVVGQVKNFQKTSSTELEASKI
jgi:hypothetical protein